MSKVSVIIPAYNAARYLPSTLDSVLGQTYRDFEVIVVDDGSTDETVEVLRSYGNRLCFAVQEHQGQAFAINRGIRMAKGEYLAYFDADDLMIPTKLEVQAGYLDQHPEVDVVYTDMYCTTPNSGTMLVKYQPLDPFRLLQRCCVCRITVMHRRACLEEVGLFNEQLTGSDDWDMWVRMSERCRMAHIDQALSEYRIHGANISFTRPKRMDHCRWARLVILQGACRRRGSPFWLRVMVFHAKVQWLVGKVPLLGERFPRLWALADRLQATYERVFLRWMARPPRPDQDPNRAASSRCPRPDPFVKDDA